MFITNLSWNNMIGLTEKKRVLLRYWTWKIWSWWRVPIGNVSLPTFKVSTVVSRTNSALQDKYWKVVCKYSCLVSPLWYTHCLIWFIFNAGGNLNKPTKGGYFFFFHYSFFCIIKRGCHFQQKNASVEQYKTLQKSRDVALYFMSLIIS